MFYNVGPSFLCAEKFFEILVASFKGPTYYVVQDRDANLLHAVGCLLLTFDLAFLSNVFRNAILFLMALSMSVMASMHFIKQSLLLVPKIGMLLNRNNFIVPGTVHIQT